MSDAQETMALTIAFVSGLFAILGVFAGAFLGRRTEYDKWLRAERAKVFSDFLRSVDEAFEKSVGALYNTNIEELERNIEVTKAYAVPLTHARIVRLHLSANERENFEKLAKSIWALHASTGLGDKRILQLQEKLNQIQGIFERHL